MVKPIELNRNNYSFNEVRDEVRVKHELRDFQLRYVSPSLGDLFIQDNDSFRRVCKSVIFTSMECYENESVIENLKKQEDMSKNGLSV